MQKIQIDNQESLSPAARNLIESMQGFLAIEGLSRTLQLLINSCVDRVIMTERNIISATEIQRLIIERLDQSDTYSVNKAEKESINSILLILKEKTITYTEEINKLESVLHTLEELVEEEKYKTK